MTPKKHDRHRIPDELIDQLLANYQKPEDLTGKDGILKELTARLLGRALEGEMTEHLGYEKHAPRAEGTTNARNGLRRKTIKVEDGELEIEVPRDRDSTFEPEIVKKRQTRFAGFDEKILALYARGMTVRDIQAHLEELYSVEVSPSLISSATSAVHEDVLAWQNRPLELVYPIVFLDALVVKVRDEGVVRNKSVYLAIGVTLDGRREVLGIWIEQTEGAKFWLKVMNELKTRGVQDILIACCDGLKGFPDAIEHVFPQATVQTCIVHMIRNSLRLVSYKDRKVVAKDLKPIYTAANREAAEAALDAFNKKWGPPLRDDHVVLASELGTRRAIPRLPARGQARDLHDQPDRGPQLEPAQAVALPRPLPRRQVRHQAALPGAASLREEMDPCALELERRPRTARYLLPRQDTHPVNMNSHRQPVAVYTVSCTLPSHTGTTLTKSHGTPVCFAFSCIRDHELPGLIVDRRKNSSVLSLGPVTDRTLPAMIHPLDRLLELRRGRSRRGARSPSTDDPEW
jgi:putative transposase